MSVDSLQGQFALDMQGVQRLKHSAARDPEAGLKEASRQFEALFLQMMLKSMRDATPKSDLFQSQQSQFYDSLMDQQWAQQLAGQGFGLAEQLTAQLRDQVRAGAGDAGTTGNTADPSDLIAGIPRCAPVSLTGRELPTPARSEQLAAPEEMAANERNAVLPSRPSAGENPWRTSAATVSNPIHNNGVPTHVRDFVQRMSEPARSASQASGVPHELILAQAALETGWGRHGIATADGRDSHNLFGIKAGGGWQGETTEVTTHEYVDGRRTRVTQTFRVYDSHDAAFADYAQLLANNPRYAGVLKAADARQAALALQQGGYATDPRYADKLMGVMDLSQASLVGDTARG